MNCFEMAQYLSPTREWAVITVSQRRITQFVTFHDMYPDTFPAVRRIDKS